MAGIKSFLGIVNYFCKFIPRCSVLAEPLLSLTRGKKGSKAKLPGVRTNKPALKLKGTPHVGANSEVPGF